MARTLSLAEKLDLLFEFGETHGISSAYRTMAEATGETANNIRKIHRGTNTNPGLKTLLSITKYFGVDLAFFNCETKAECERYLETIRQKLVLDRIALRSSGISEAGLEALERMVDYVREAEGLRRRPADEK